MKTKTPNTGNKEFKEITQAFWESELADMPFKIINGKKKRQMQTWKQWQFRRQIQEGFEEVNIDKGKFFDAALGTETKVGDKKCGFYDIDRYIKGKGTKPETLQKNTTGCGLAETRDTQEGNLFHAGRHGTLGWLSPIESRANLVNTNRYNEVKSFSNLIRLKFVNRFDCYCIQLRQGYRRIDMPLTEEILFKHFSGEITVGSYQLDKNSLVKWLCFDFDPEKLPNPKEATKKVITTLLEKREGNEETKTPQVWQNCIVLEASRYPDPSYHIWVLFQELVKAKIARWLGLRILEIAGLSPKQVEVFPKQDEVTHERPYGNFVKLPFGKHQVECKWSKMLHLESFDPLPFEQLEGKHGLSFSDKDLEKLENIETKKSVQITFEAPTVFKKLSDKEEEKIACFLVKYWQPGYRNDLTLSFCGMCIKQDVSHDSARRVIREVCQRTCTSAFETSEFLQKVDYQFTHRLKIGNLKGISGIREVVEAIKQNRLLR